MKKRAYGLIGGLFCFLAAQAQMKWTQTYQTYIDQYKNIAIEQMLRYNIPASITLAQGLLESAAGQSELSRKGNNHFGIKCHGWSGAMTYHNDDASNECFRAYGSVRDSYEDHSVFLVSSPRYQALFRLKRTDYSGWARGLKSCGYATNPKYADKLIEIIDLYRLYQYDTAQGYQPVSGAASAGGGGAGGGLHPIYPYNKNYYLRARQGDTFASIGKEVGVSARKLAKRNERPVKGVLEPDAIVYLKKKRTKAEKVYKKVPHTVKAGDSMYSIAQLYGIRLKSLYKKNHLAPDYQLRVGDRLKVY